MLSDYMARLKDEDFAPELSKAARALLGWSAKDMSSVTGIGVTTLRKFESNQHTTDQSKKAIREAFEEAGVEFTNGGKPGARLNRPLYRQ